MLQKVVDVVPDALVGQLLLGGGILLAVLGVGYTLGSGTEGLMALGLSRQVAGSIVVALVVAVCLYGLYLFATRVIDW
jgi:hypothetical protein